MRSRAAASWSMNESMSALLGGNFSRQYWRNNCSTFATRSGMERIRGPLHIKTRRFGGRVLGETRLDALSGFVRQSEERPVQCPFIIAPFQFTVDLQAS